MDGLETSPVNLVEEEAFSHILKMSARHIRRISELERQLKEIRDVGLKAESDPTQLRLFAGMTKSLDDTYNRFVAEFTKLEDLDYEEGAHTLLTDGIRAQSDRARRYYYEAQGSADSLKEDKNSRTSSLGNPLDPNMFGNRSRPSLPAIPIPTFDGSRLEWRKFYDKFNSVVNQDATLTDMEKFHYLVSALKGPPAALIGKLPLIASNYNIAWKTLKATYDNPRLLAGAYLDQLLDIKPCQRKLSNESLRIMILQISECVEAFKSLPIPDHLDFLIYHITRRCLDPETRDVVELAHAGADVPTFDTMIQFLLKRCDALEASSGLKLEPITPTNFRTIPRQSKGYASVNKRYGSHTVLSATAHQCSDRSPSTSKERPHKSKPQGPKVSCYICREPHPIYACEKFKALSINDRYVALKGWKGCMCCLTEGHQIGNCKSRWQCRECKGRHHTLLHQTKQEVSAAVAQSQEDIHLREATTACAHAGKLEISSLLGTAIARVQASSTSMNKKKALVRMVIDTGSHVSFITRKTADSIGMRVQPSDLQIKGIAGITMPGYRGTSKCILSVPTRPEIKLEASVIVVDTIMAPHPRKPLPANVSEPFLKFELADPHFSEPRDIDFLLGCDLVGDVLTGEVITIPDSSARLLGTCFGFVVIGRVTDTSIPIQPCVLAAETGSSWESELHQQLQRFWEVEEPPQANLMSDEDSQCEEYFRQTVSRDGSGRYIVKLSFKARPPPFFKHSGASLRRLTHLESKLSRNAHHKELYHEFMAEYLRLNHMEIAETAGACYIPHHAVFKGTPPHEKIRVVFDASAQMQPGSLNSHLWTGPKLQNDIARVLLNFRRHKFVFTVDIEKMYRQILVHPEDRRYQHIWWRFDPAQAIQDYELRTLTYGLACAPYLALRVIRQLIADEGEAYPLAAAVLLTDMYVDDLITGAATLEEAKKLQAEVIQLMAAGAFPLGKWASNCDELVPTEAREEPLTPVKDMDLESDRCVKILGLQWISQEDVFTFAIEVPPPVFTKRGVLSSISRIYDPLGFLGPVVITAKIILQKAWLAKLDWDTPLTNELLQETEAFYSELPMLRATRIPRCMLPGRCTHVLVFADASEKAYCATVYLRLQSAHGIETLLMMSKTKVAPIQHQSIPRLELCASLLAANLINAVKDIVDACASKPKLCLFTDSQLVLGWLRRPHQKLPVFVKNRVARILEVTHQEDWYHVRSGDNPSDLGSRGMKPSQLLANPLWFHGPPWAKEEPSEWNLDSSSAMEVSSPHLINTLVTHPITPEDPPWYDNLSSYVTAVRVNAWILRFVQNCRNKSVPVSGPLSLQEWNESIAVLCQMAQKRAWREIGAKVPKDLQPLAPFYDERGLLRVGGRLKNAPLPMQVKHPILLPNTSHLSVLIARHYHHTSLHPGPSLLMALIRTKFWIPGLRNLTRKICRGCVKCRQAEAPSCQPPMGNLPDSRFASGRAFLQVGVDFGGPFIVRDSVRRKAQTSKAYLCLFICLATKAVHLEAVSSLSTAAFLATLERFIGRRGLPTALFSDNGTNFVGAANKLQEWYKWQSESEVQSSILQYANQKEFQWNFIPPHSPHFGGLWEAGIKSAKRLLRAVYGDGLLTFEELSTLFIKAEAALNSRPICPLSNDPHDGDCLTPGHFLIGTSLHAPPEPCLLDTKTNYVQRWTVVNRMTQHFWNRWRKEYLSVLQVRAKWHRPEDNLQVGDLVLIRDDRVPRLQWPRGRVTHIHPGNDGVVRVVTLRSKGNSLKRSVINLVPLFAPCSDE